MTDLDTQFHDGVYLTLIMGLLEGFFVPLYNFYLTPQTFEEKVHNVALSFELMQDVGLAKPKARPEGGLPSPEKNCAQKLKTEFFTFRYSEPGPEVDTSRALQSVHQV